jgi:hypothetical protein
MLVLQFVLKMIELVNSEIIMLTLAEDTASVFSITWFLANTHASQSSMILTTPQILGGKTLR